MEVNVDPPVISDDAYEFQLSLSTFFDLQCEGRL